jgi:DNA-binding transcriptional LysR family regulator
MDLLAQMATFVRVVETGSLSAAARSLRLSVPAISRQLASLERDLGATLVLRTTRRLRLTDAGQSFHGRCLRVLKDVDEARQSLGTAAGVAGTLSISAPFSLGMHCVAPRLPALLARHPRLSIELRFEDNLVDMVAERVDVVVRAGAPIASSPSLIAQPLVSFRRVLVASPGYLRRHGSPRTVEALAGHACLVQLGGVGPISTWALSAGSERRAVVVTGRLSMTAPMALREAAIAGAGIAWLADWLVAADLDEGRLARVLPAWASEPVSAWAVYRVESRRSPAIAAVIAALRPPVPDPEPTAPGPRRAPPAPAPPPRRPPRRRSPG